MRRTVLATTLIVLMFAATQSRAAVIFQDDFESNAVGTHVSLNNWTVSNGTVDVVGTGFFPQLGAPPSEKPRQHPRDALTWTGRAGMRGESHRPS